MKVLGVGVLVCALALGVQARVPAQTATQASMPTWTEAETLRLQNYDLQWRLAQAQLQIIQAAMQQTAQAREAFLAEAERAHPGWRVNRETFAWERVVPTKQ